MLRPRIIPCLLIHNGGLVKTKNFSEPRYVGDPINAVRIFNEKEADELMILDIDASVKGKEPNFKLIAKLASECRMPLCYGGGITKVEQVQHLINIGVEKVAISSAAIARPSLVADMANAVGSQSITVVLDIRKRQRLMSSKYEVCTHNARQSHTTDFLTLISEFQKQGAGEIVINSVDRDGIMKGYDLELAAKVKSLAKVPVTFLGGAGSLEDLSSLVSLAGIVGAAAGSLFVFKGKYRAVLITYPDRHLKNMIFKGLEK
ncbi:AglZ/HisF2 family acetamidino modification protein [Gammaproteobacteria bacterium]|jgi:imidazole glycerol-phosphate synthase subunit HisF|nr:AglZ/HisF2 family acetamidino modification protein [Gammaproteobacteria bacterium]|tara:strand:+ start:7053 stop:7835 length:783 start_codon:yes stop_codon:yes gene_type:complete